MATKNTRTSVKKVTTENRLKKKLKEDYDNFLHEEDDELPTDETDPEGMGGGDDMGFDAEGGEETNGDLGGETDVEGGTGGLDGLDGEDIDLNPSQEEWMDAEVDELLGGSLADTGDEGFELDENGGDDFVMEDEFDSEGLDGGLEDDGMGGDDLSLEDSPEEIGDVDGEQHNHGVHVDHGDDVFTADELNQIIGSPDSLYDLEDSLVQKVGNMDDEELGGDISGIEDEGMDGEGLEDDDDQFLGEDAGDHKEPMTGLKGDDHGGFEQGYEGGKNKNQGFQVKDELMEADIMKALGWTETKSKTESKPAKVTANAKTGNIPSKKNLGDGDFDKVSDTVKESIKKSKMLIKAGSVIVKLKEAMQKLQMENYKLTKVNGILSAIGDRLTKEARKKISESFAKCKSEKEVNTIYEQVVIVVRKSNKRPSLNETVQQKKTVVKTVIAESKQMPPAKVKRELTEDVKRKAFLMGIPGYDDQYFRD